MQDLPHLTQFFVHNWHQNRHIDNNTIIIARWEEREVFFRFSARKNFRVPETRTHDLCVLSAAFSRNLDERLFWPRSSGIFSALVQWLVGRNGTNFTGLAAVPIMTLDWPRLTSLYPFSIQTAASHGLDYSTSLPVPAKLGLFMSKFLFYYIKANLHSVFIRSFVLKVEAYQDRK